MFEWPYCYKYQVLAFYISSREATTQPQRRKKRPYTRLPPSAEFVYARWDTTNPPPLVYLNLIRREVVRHTEEVIDAGPHKVKPNSVERFLREVYGRNYVEEVITDKDNRSG